MILCQIDSAGIQELVQIIVQFGSNYIPPMVKPLTPVISALVTALTAAIIRMIEKRKIQKSYEREINYLKHITLQKASEDEQKI